MKIKVEHIYEKLKQNIESIYDKNGISIINRIVFTFSMFVFVVFFFFVINLAFINKQITTDIQNTYCDTIDEAVDNLNTHSLTILKTFYTDKNVLISPLSLQNGVYNYTNLNNVRNDDVLRVFNDGYKDWLSSAKLFEEDAIKTFTCGNVKNRYATIQGNISESLVIDEINANIQTLTNNCFKTKLADVNLSNYNIICLTCLDADIGACYEVDDDLILTGEYSIYSTDSWDCVEIPLNDNKYTLYNVKGSNFSDFELNALTDEIKITKDCAIKLKNIQWEQIGNPNTFIYNTNYSEILVKDFYLKNIVTMLHYNMVYEPKEYTFNGAIDYDFSQDSIFYIKNNATKEIILLGALT